MTEFEAACEFVKAFAARTFAATRRGERPDEEDAFLDWCGETGLAPSLERLELAMDVAAVAREYHWCGEGDEAWLYPDDLDAVPLLHLTDGLEARGWRLAFLDADAAA